MTIDQKARSLHCGLQAGLSFQELNGEQVVFLHDVPFELENIISLWMFSLPTDPIDNATSKEFLRNDTQKGLALTAQGWSAFISWMINELRDAQMRSDFPEKVAEQINRM